MGREASGACAAQEGLHERDGNFSWASSAKQNMDSQGRKKEFQVGLTGEQNWGDQNLMARMNGESGRLFQLQRSETQSSWFQGKEGLCQR